MLRHIGGAPDSKIYGLLISTSISENQGLEKSNQSASNLRKFSGPANDFFLGLYVDHSLSYFSFLLCLLYAFKKKIKILENSKFNPM